MYIHLFSLPLILKPQCIFLCYFIDLFATDSSFFFIFWTKRRKKVVTVFLPLPQGKELTIISPDY